MASNHLSEENHPFLSLLIYLYYLLSLSWAFYPTDFLSLLSSIYEQIVGILARGRGRVPVV
ncbi:hypothetical protein [Nostoc sp.]|uniref:hypothetical protein n=1 Tax=Nostoc sp. TaxID=1180 RepID=UPI0035945D66